MQADRTHLWWIRDYQCACLEGKRQRDAMQQCKPRLLLSSYAAAAICHVRGSQTRYAALALSVGFICHTQVTGAWLPMDTSREKNILNFGRGAFCKHHFTIKPHSTRDALRNYEQTADRQQTTRQQMTSA